MRALAWCGVLAPVLRLGLILLLGVLDPDYSQLRDHISELGARDAPSAGVMNFVGTIVVGILLLMFSVVLRRVSGPGVLRTVGATSLAVSGVAFVVVGLFPCDPGCSLAAPSTTMRVHLYAGTLAMTTQALAPMAFGLRIVSGSGDRRYAAMSLTCGTIALIAVIMLFSQGAALRFPGLVQKAFQVAADLWVLLSAIHLLGIGRPRPDTLLRSGL